MLGCLLNRPEALALSLLDIDLEKFLRDLFLRLDQHTQDEIVIIGGQALSIWAYHYLFDEITGEEEAFLTSNDLDFIGRRPNIERCAEAWNTDYQIPDAFNPTPNSGLICIDHDLDKNPLLDEHGEKAELIVDFLEHVHGVPDNELAKGVDIVCIDDKFHPRILTPALCLKSRIRNLYSLAYTQEQIPRERVRAQLAARVTQKYIIDLLESNEQRRALGWANNVLKLCASPCGVQMSVKHGLEPLEAIPESHQGFGDKFKNRHYKAMLEKITRKRRSYQDRLSALSGHAEKENLF